MTATRAGSQWLVDVDSLERELDLIGAGYALALLSVTDKVQAAKTTTRPQLNTPTLNADGQSSIVAALREQLRTQKHQYETELATRKAEIKQLSADLAAAHGEIHRLRSTGAGSWPGHSTDLSYPFVRRQPRQIEDQLAETGFGICQDLSSGIGTRRPVRPCSFSRKRKTPSSSLASTTRSARARTAGWALAVAMAWSATSNMGRSLR